MLIRQLWTDNPLRNFNYLVACPDSGEALAIDPLDFKLCLDTAKDAGWEITQVLNTHHHGDHTGGNRGIIKATGAKLLAHKDAGSSISGIDEGLGTNDFIKIGKHIRLRCLDTPGHTMSHICALSDTDEPALFSGDTLFNAGAGNCTNGGHPVAMFNTYETQLSKLDPTIKLYPGHDYLQNNLGFTLDREPDNAAAQELLTSLGNYDPANAIVTTLAEEFEINTFFRLEQTSLVEKLQSDFPEIGDSPSRETVFLKLRELRNSW